MTSAYDVAVLIGRFQPFHNAHAALLRQALDSATKVCVVLGAAGRARDLCHPFSAEERAAMIGTTLGEAERERVHFVPVRDYFDDRRWVQAVQAAVRAACPEGKRVSLHGAPRGTASACRHYFPAWEFVATPWQEDLDAASLRRIYFEGDDTQAAQALLSTLLPAAVCHYLQGWMQLPAYPRLRTEQAWLTDYHQTWGRGPFITVDALVRVADHVLLVQRGHPPGKGLWALPGGFLDPSERVLQGAMRELREETGFDLPDAELEASLSAVLVADQPERSVRGRTITHVHCFDLRLARLPEVVGADDAAAARWVPTKSLAAMEGECFEDHFQILDHFLGLTA